MNVTISRFNRDRGMFEFLRDEVLRSGMRVWSAGCASGEEPYTLALLCDGLDILATDVDPAMLRRAEAARYPDSALRELPDHDAFDAGVLDERYRHVTFARHDVREEPPAGRFDLVLCRNLVFTYFDEATQRAALERFARVTPALVIGAHEALPEGQRLFDPWARCVFRRSPDSSGRRASPACRTAPAAPPAARRRSRSGPSRGSPPSRCGRPRSPSRPG